jgi:hypothetical protein
MFMAQVLQYLTTIGIRRLVVFWFRQQTPFRLLRIKIRSIYAVGDRKMTVQIS